MRLSKLLKRSDETFFAEFDLPKKWQDYDVLGVALNSTDCEKGFVFIAVPGGGISPASDGRKYISDAVARGAGVVITLPNSNLHNDDICIIEHPNARLLAGKIADILYPNKPENIVAVTGTNGKTSVADFVRQIVATVHGAAASIGTIGSFIQKNKDLEQIFEGDLTTPDAVNLNRRLAEIKGMDIDNIVLEASSIGLDQKRLSGAKISVGAITNITHDHLDYHGDLESYIAAKLLLFSEVVVEGGFAVINNAIACKDEIIEITEKRNLQVITYGEGGDIALGFVKANHSGLEINFIYKGQNYDLSVPVMGVFQAENILCSLGVGIALGYEINQMVASLRNIKAAPGRMEIVGGDEAKSLILADYAHTPDALEKALESTREHMQGGKLHVVFGCGGNRDKAKRVLMGQVAVKLADAIIITDDNPRHEDAGQIRKEILAACNGAKEIAGRAEAIKYAIENMSEGDSLLVAGKGHEDYQQIGDTKHHFSDREEILQVLRND